ncbi:MAG: DEAD/DEAH box helicase [Microthrixaceae bacterium]|nr:DEAD/DEAH box helicase [Microthrixaceae bacterium]
MAHGPDIRALTDSVIEDFYDPGSIRRGTAYAAEHRVTVLSVEPGAAAGIVEGSSRTPYLVRLDWQHDPIGIDIVDSCSCPLGGECKHAVALILTARGTSSPASSPDWRSALSAIVADVDGDDAPSGEPLALEVAVSSPKRSTYAAEPTPQVTLRPLRMGRSGRWIKTGVSWRDLNSPYDYALRDLDPTQRSVLRSMLAGARNIGYDLGTGPLPLSQFGPEVWPHLRRAVDSGIALVRERSATGGVAVSDTPARVSIDVTGDEDGNATLHATLVLDGEPLTLPYGRHGMVGTPPHGLYVLGDALRLIPLERPLHPELARLVDGPPINVPAEDLDELIDEYQPRLARIAEIGSSDGSVTFLDTEFTGLVAAVAHDEVSSANLVWYARYRRGERLLTHRLRDPLRPGRDRAAETAAIDELDLPTHLLGSLARPGGRPADLSLTGTDAVVLLGEVVPWLQDRGQVTVEVSGDAPELREATGDPLISLTITDTETTDSHDTGRNDWFDLAVQVSIDGEVVEFADLFAALTRDDELIVLDSGTWIRLDRPEFSKLRDLIEEARKLSGEDDSGTVRMNPFQTSWWDELSGLGVVQDQSKRWEARVSRMRDLCEPEPVEPPAGLAASLRDYQRDGLDWLAFLHRNQLGGILADDMGLGKTVQALALFLHVLERSPDARFLVVAPTSVVENWHREAAQFAPDVGVRTIRSTAARRGTELTDEVSGARIVITSYALFRLDFEHFAALDWEMLVLDEAQFVKNHKGKTYQCTRRLEAPTKIAITGTPLENSLMDLWSLLSITAPGLYPDPQRFSEAYRSPIESGSAPELLATLRRRIAPLVRRRTKDEVLTELPPKTELTVEVELNPRHSRIYQTQLQRERQKVLGLVDDMQKNRFEVLKSLTLLRQLALDPALVDERHDEVGSAKLDRLVADLEQVVAEGHRALVFSQFTRYLARVRGRLDSAGIDHSYLDGRTRNREQAISGFKDGEVPVFVISLKAGGFGLNLTEADYCFVLDPWWNPAVETQATDRAHRIGQRNAVMVYRYVSVDTIETKVMELKQHKADLFASVMDADGSLSGALSGEDVRGLLELAG